MTAEERAGMIAQLDQGIQERERILTTQPLHPRREELAAKIIGLKAERDALNVPTEVH
jgi:hypothetical protein